MFSTFPNPEPSSDLNLARARVEGQEGMLATIAGPLYDIATERLTEQEDLLVSVVRGMVLHGQERIAEQRETLQTIGNTLATLARSRLGTHTAQLQYVAATSHRRNRRVGRSGESLVAGWYCTIDTLTGEHCVKRQSDESRIPTTDYIFSGPHAEESQAASVCRAHAESVDAATVEMVPTDTGRPLSPVSGEEPPGQETSPVIPPSSQGPLAFLSPIQPRPTPREACPTPTSPDKPVKDIDYYDLLSIDGLLAILGLPREHPDRRRAREYYGQGWYAVFDANSLSELTEALRLDLGSFSEGPRPTAERPGFGAIFGD